MLPPFYYKPVTDDGLFDAYSAVIDRVADSRLRIYLYHIPQNSGVPITHGLIEKLRAAYPEIVVGIKDSAGDFANMQGMIRNFPGFRVFSGSDAFLLDILREGGAGAITACNNICAAASAKVFANWRNDNADALQKTVNDVRTVVQQYPLVAALKEVVAESTGEAGWRRQRPPLEPLSREEAASLLAQLAASDFALASAA
jgi:4-hydroxy-tetrahydrodipicolinate synthase